MTADGAQKTAETLDVRHANCAREADEASASTLVRSQRRHPEGARFHQRDEGSPVQQAYAA